MARKSAVDRTILEAALEGLQHRLETINEKIAEVKGLLSGRAKAPAAVESSTEKPTRRRKMSAAARKRIAEAQRRRWQQFRAAQKSGGRRGRAAAKAPAEEAAE
jgi:peptidoglycan hydrolase CwlO-like protein